MPDGAGRSTVDDVEAARGRPRATSASAGGCWRRRRARGGSAAATTWSPPGARQMPVHVHGDEEEIFFVVSGDGLSWQRGSACAVGPGDAVVHRPRGDPHTFLAGDDGLELLAFASGSDTSHHLPAARQGDVVRAAVGAGRLAASVPGRGRRRAARAARSRASGPPNVVALDQVDTGPFPGRRGPHARAGRRVGQGRAEPRHAARGRRRGAARTAIRSRRSCSTCWPGRASLRLGAEEHPLRPGDVVARPPSTGVRPLAGGRRGGPDVPGLRHPRARGQRLLPGDGQGAAARARGHAGRAAG